MGKQAGMWYLVFIICLAAARAEVSQNNATSRQERQEREERVLSVFNVVTFPNSACGASNGYNGTCASSFGVCCVFSIACGGTSSANNSYAIISSYSVSSDADPCTYRAVMRYLDRHYLKFKFN